MKRLLSLSLFLMTAMMSFAHHFEVENADGKTIYYNITSSTELTVEVTYKGTFAIHNADTYIGSVIIPETVKNGNKTYSVTSIGDDAFTRCSGLTFVSIPSSVTSIGKNAFFNCSGLTSINIPSSVTAIGKWAFSNCTEITNITIPSSVVSIGEGALPHNSIIYVEKGSKTLVEVWKVSYDDSVIYDLDKSTELPKPYITFISSTQTSITLELNNYYDDYLFTIGNNSTTDKKYKLNKGTNTITGLYPEYYAFLFIDEDRIHTTVSASTKSLDMRLTTTKKNASSVTLKGRYTKDDANIVSTFVTVNGKTVSGNEMTITGLKPNTKYTATYYVRVLYGENNKYTKNYTKESEFTTEKLTLTTEQPKVVSVGNVIVSATTNVDEKEEDIGFEWRRTDWINDFKSNTGVAYLYEGTMEGYIRNLYTGALWMVRPYYMASDGTYYYGDWMGIDPVNTSYFEPTVHTYANINIEGNTALVKGYALGGTDKITVQGFKYWKAANLAPSGDLALEARKASPVIPANAETIEAEGRVMEATLSGLDYECTYSYVAFAKTEEGTFYGDIKTFTTGPNTTGIEVVRVASSEAKAADDKVKGIYTLTGVKLSDDATDLKTLKRGIYIVNGRKVAVK